MIGNLIGGGLGVIGGLFGDNQAGRAERQAQEMRNNALRDLMNIDLPDIEAMKRDYEVPELMGKLTPQMEQALALGDSAYEDVAIDPRLQQAQFDALAQLGEISQGGLTDADMMGLEQVRRNAAGQDQARQEAILQQMQQRGFGGFGNELIAKLSSGQAAADRASQEGMQIAQMAQQRALEALMNQGNMASSVRSQEFGEQSRAADARDIINRFNVQNQQGVQQRNIGQQNMAQQQNLSARQAQENQRAATRNLEQDINRGQLPQQQFDNTMRRQAPITQIQTGMANQEQQAGYNRADRTRGMFNSFGDMAGAIGGMLGKDK